MTAANIVCIKWGDKYPAYYVNRLYRGVERFLKRKFRFVCFTDRPDGITSEVEIRPLPVEPFESTIERLMTEGLRVGMGLTIRRGAWRKVSLYQPGLMGFDGPILGLDIDVVITGPLDELLDYAPGKVCMRRDWMAQQRFRNFGNSSVFRFDPARHGYIYQEFAADPEGCAQRAKGAEQRHTSQTAMAHGDFEYYPTRWISSFKSDAVPFPPLNHLIAPRIPPDTRVMVFHGKPKMEQAMAGYRGKWHRATRPAAWLKDYWVQERP